MYIDQTQSTCSLGEFMDLWNDSMLDEYDDNGDYNEDYAKILKAPLKERIAFVHNIIVDHSLYFKDMIACVVPRQTLMSDWLKSRVRKKTWRTTKLFSYKGKDGIVTVWRIQK